MAEDKRNRREQPQGGNQGPDRDRAKTVNPAARSLPGSGRARKEDEEEPQE